MGIYGTMLQTSILKEVWKPPESSVCAAFHIQGKEGAKMSSLVSALLSKDK
jgi:hypothetical protein